MRWFWTNGLNLSVNPALVDISFHELLCQRTIWGHLYRTDWVRNTDTIETTTLKTPRFSDYLSCSLLHWVIIISMNSSRRILTCFLLQTGGHCGSQKVLFKNKIYQIIVAAFLTIVLKSISRSVLCFVQYNSAIAGFKILYRTWSLVSVCTFGFKCVSSRKNQPKFTLTSFLSSVLEKGFWVNSRGRFLGVLSKQVIWRVLDSTYSLCSYMGVVV